jgi:citrate synthase
MVREIDARRIVAGARRRRARGDARLARAGSAIPAYGHPLHKERDERVGALFDVARAPAPTCDFVANRRAAEALLPQC